MPKSELVKQLKYKLPRLRLCLVKEGRTVRKYRIRTVDDAAKFLAPLAHAAEEHFVSLHLNSKHEVIGMHEVSHGTLSASLVHPREVFKAAILANSHAMLICHNHPSGAELSPSCEDIQTTKLLLKAAELMGIILIDHVIIGLGQNAYSIRENHPALWQSDTA